MVKLLKSPVSGFGSAAVGLFVWDADTYPIKKLSFGHGLGFRWLPIDQDNQHIPYSWRQYIKDIGKAGGMWGLKHLGEHIICDLVIEMTKKKQDNLPGLRWLPVDDFILNNQPKTCGRCGVLERGYNWGGARKGCVSIILLGVRAKVKN